MNEHEASIQVVKAGLFTTVQDLGRTGYQQFGVPVSGAADSIALRIANLLVGNQETAAGLEMTLTGPTLQISCDCLLSVTGGKVTPMLGDIPIEMYKSIYVKAGATLRFGAVEQGCRAYLAIRGGIDVPVVMGSRSTYIKGSLGGFQGRALRAGDVLSIFSQELDVVQRKRAMQSLSNRRMHPEYIPVHTEIKRLRVIVGPHAEAFTDESVARFWTQRYTVSTLADRMGLRLIGEPLIHKSGADVISGGVPMGAVQVPANGQPILLLSERQPTGGYTRIGTVITVDLPLVAQARPSDQLHFQPISLEEAHRLLTERENRMKQLRLACLATRREKR